MLGIRCGVNSFLLSGEVNVKSVNKNNKSRDNFLLYMASNNKHALPPAAGPYVTTDQVLKVRMFYGYLESNINRPYQVDTYMNMIHDISDKHQLHNIVISIDNEEFLEPYLMLPNVTIIRKPIHFNALQYAVFKMLVLSHSAHFIGNRISTFTELVFWFSHHKTIMHTVF
jgi:hypothetical protein